MAVTIACTDRRRLGRYERDPEASPRCEHDPSGTLGYPAGEVTRDPSYRGAIASHVVCDREACQLDVAAWVRVRTGHDAVFSTFAENRAQA